MKEIKLDYTPEYIMLFVSLIGILLVLIGFMVYNSGYDDAMEKCREAAQAANNCYMNH